MYYRAGLSQVLIPGTDTPAQRRTEERERVEAREEFAARRFPGLTVDEAFAITAQQAEGRELGRELQEDYWPILAAVGAGLVLMTALR